MAKIKLMFLTVPFFLIISCSQHNAKLRPEKMSSLENKCRSVKLSHDSIFSIISKLGLCIGVSEKKWKKNEKDYLSQGYYYRCDSNYLKIYPLLKDNDALFLVEILINHGSGEYDNYIIGDSEGTFHIVQGFKGYVDTVIPSRNDTFDIISTFMVDNDVSIKELGKWQTDGFYSDSIIDVFSYLGIEFNKNNIKSHYLKNRKWNG